MDKRTEELSSVSLANWNLGSLYIANNNHGIYNATIVTPHILHGMLTPSTNAILWLHIDILFKDLQKRLIKGNFYAVSVYIHTFLK